MLAKEISATLRRVSDALGNFRNVNSGGCGFVALEVAKCLSELGVKNEIVTSKDWDADDVDEVRQRLSDPLDMHEWKENGVYFGHVGVRVWLNKHESGIYDSEGFLPWSAQSFPAFPDLEPAKGAFTEQEMEAFVAETHEGWNELFNRRQMPAMRKAIRAAFNQAKVKEVEHA